MFVSETEGDFYTALAMGIASAIGADGHSVTIESQPDDGIGYRLVVNKDWQTTIQPGRFRKKGTRITVRKQRLLDLSALKSRLTGGEKRKILHLSGLRNFLPRRTPEYKKIFDACRVIQTPVILRKNFLARYFTET